MFDERSLTSDGASLARSVRTLARQARQALAHPGDEAEARRLLEAIEGLERRVEPGTSKDLGRWLASLRRSVEDRLPTAV
jgi:hypothetical protein